MKTQKFAQINEVEGPAGGTLYFGEECIMVFV